MNTIIRIISFHCCAPIFKWYTVSSWITRIHFILKINNIKLCSLKLPLTILRILHTSNLLIFQRKRNILYLVIRIFYLHGLSFCFRSCYGSDFKIGTNKQSIDYKSTWHVFRSNDFLPNCSHHWCKQLVVCDDPVLKSIDGHLEKTTQNSLFVSKSHCEDSEIGLEWMQPIYVSFDNIYRMYL